MSSLETEGALSEVIMADNSLTSPSGRKRQWFARRQVYLRTGQDSQYVELSPALQIGVALGFGALAFWLISASYGAVSHVLGQEEQTALLAKLQTTEQALDDVRQERDVALEGAARAVDLEAALAEAQADIAEAPEGNETLALTTELEQTRAQLEDLHLRLSESKADQAALQAKFEAEALATADASDKTAQEALSLHAQLEDAFREIEALETERDDVSAKLEALEKSSVAKAEESERNTALLKAATAEIERLQSNIALVEDEARENAENYETTIGKLEEELGGVVADRNDLESEIVRLDNELEETRTAASETAESKEAAVIEARTTADAQVQALSIAADLKEAEQLATIDDLRSKLAESDARNSVAEDGSGTNGVEDDDRIQALKQRVVVAESEIERLILSGLKEQIETQVPPEAAATPAADGADQDPAETERLRSDLLAAQANIIKLNADVKAAKQRLAERAEPENDQAPRPDVTAKLEQQLASTRSRVQQLNKALADAKLREVAIDLALINVVPSPSPPAPR